MTKTILLLLAVTLYSFGLVAQDSLESGPIITFDKLIHDFGELEIGQEAKATFRLTNKGTSPLILKNVKGNCSCVQISWPPEPIESGESAEIKVRYDSKKATLVNKAITVSSNASNTTIKVLRIKGLIKAPIPDLEKQ